MNRNKIEVIISNRGAGPAAEGETSRVDITFELSWLKHEFVAGLSAFLSPEVIVDDLLVPQAVKDKIRMDALSRSRSPVRGDVNDLPRKIEQLDTTAARKEHYGSKKPMGERKRLTISPQRSRGNGGSSASSPRTPLFGSASERDPHMGRLFMIGDRKGCSMDGGLPSSCLSYSGPSCPALVVNTSAIKTVKTPACVGIPPQYKCCDPFCTAPAE